MTCPTCGKHLSHVWETFVPHVGQVNILLVDALNMLDMWFPSLSVQRESTFLIGTSLLLK